MSRLIDADKLMLSLNDNYLANSPTGNETLEVQDYRESVCEGLEIAMKTVEDAPTVGGWISVKDRMPELRRYEEDGDTWLMSAPVLVATTKGVTIGYYEDDLDPKFKPGWNDREHGEKIKVTHWMELLERPEVGK